MEPNVSGGKVTDNDENDANKNSFARKYIINSAHFVHDNY